MDRKIGMAASAVNAGAVFCFAVSMLFGFDFGSYLSSLLIALSFLPMMCAYACFSKENAKAAGLAAVGFSGVYTAMIALVYFAQLTTVRTGGLTDQAEALLDFQRFGLFFNYDLLGYAFMALATLFAGLTIQSGTGEGRWLKGLLLVHGLFSISCFVLPMLGLFTADGEAWVGTAVLEFWCAYFLPVGILSFRHFSKQPR